MPNQPENNNQQTPEQGGYHERAREVLEKRHEIEEYRRRLDELEHERVCELRQNLEQIESAFDQLRAGEGQGDLNQVFQRIEQIKTEIEQLEISQRRERGFTAAQTMVERIRTIPEDNRNAEEKWIVKAIEFTLSNVNEQGKVTVTHQFEGRQYETQEGLPVDRLISWVETHRPGIPRDQLEEYDRHLNNLRNLSVSWREQQFGRNVNPANMTPEERNKWRARVDKERQFMGSPDDFRNPGDAEQEMIDRRVLDFTSDRRQTAAELEDRKRRDLNLGMVYQKLKDDGVPESQILGRPEFKQALLAEKQEVLKELGPEIKEIIHALKEGKKAGDIEAVLQSACDKAGLTLDEAKRDVFGSETNELEKEAERKSRDIGKFRMALRTITSVSGAGLLIGIVGGAVSGGLGTALWAGGTAALRGGEALYTLFTNPGKKRKELRALRQKLGDTECQEYKSVVDDIAALIAYKKQQKIFELQREREGQTSPEQALKNAREQHLNVVEQKKHDEAYNRESEVTFSGNNGFEAKLKTYREDMVDRQLDLLKKRFPDKSDTELLDYAICRGALAEKDEYHKLSGDEMEIRHEGKIKRLLKRFAHVEKKGSAVGTLATAVAIPAARIAVGGASEVLDRISGTWMGAKAGEGMVRFVQFVRGKGDIGEVCAEDLRVLDGELQVADMNKYFKGKIPRKIRRQIEEGPVALAKVREQAIAKARKQLADRRWREKNPVAAAKLWEQLDALDQRMPEKQAAVAALDAIDASMATASDEEKYKAYLRFSTKQRMAGEEAIIEQWEKDKKNWGAARAGGYLLGGAAGFVFGPDMFQYLRDRLEANTAAAQAQAQVQPQTLTPGTQPIEPETLQPTQPYGPPPPPDPNAPLEPTFPTEPSEPGQPADIPKDAIVGKGEGVTHALVRQLQAENPDLSDKEAILQARDIAIKQGYIQVDSDGKMIGDVRVAEADRVAYMLTHNEDGSYSITEVDTQAPTGVEPQHAPGTLDSYEYTHDYTQEAANVIPASAESAAQGADIIRPDSIPEATWNEITSAITEAKSIDEAISTMPAVDYTKADAGPVIELLQDKVADLGYKNMHIMDVHLNNQGHIIDLHGNIEGVNVFFQGDIKALEPGRVGELVEQVFKLGRFMDAHPQEFVGRGSMTINAAGEILGVKLTVPGVDDPIPLKLDDTLAVKAAFGDPAKIPSAIHEHLFFKDLTARGNLDNLLDALNKEVKIQNTVEQLTKNFLDNKFAGAKGDAVNTLHDFVEQNQDSIRYLNNNDLAQKLADSFKGNKAIQDVILAKIK